MKLYQIIYDETSNPVEAESFGEAILIWREYLIDENPPGDIEPDVEPESVRLVHDGPVWRGEPGVAATAKVDATFVFSREEELLAKRIIARIEEGWGPDELVDWLRLACEGKSL